MAGRRPLGLAARAELDELAARLQDGVHRPNASPLWALLLDDLAHRRTASWDAHRSECASLHEVAPQALRLRTLLARLGAVAPQWAAAIVHDPEAAGDPQLLGDAWQWRQLETWVTSIAKGDDPAQLQRRLEELSKERRRIVAELVSQRAWRRLGDNLGDAQRSALNSYLYAVKRFGKTGGKFAARWLAEMRVALNESKDAVPVWIMTTGRALTSFRPAATPPFDLLVVDEASQIGLEAIPLLSLAKSTIIVGDDKQTSPENVGVDQQDFFKLLDRFLTEVPKYKVLFDLNASLYDLAFQKFPGEIMLTEHFRSLPGIIDFSNTHVYDGRIIPLRDRPPRPGWKALGTIKVTDGYRQGDINVPEADAVVDLIGSMCEDPDYEGMSFGVVSLLGTSQSKLIWEKLYDRVGPDVMTKRRIRCGEPANFQGDERDVVVITLVVATDPNNPTRPIAAMTGLPAERRINVAASRPRQQLWVVHSVEPDRFPRGDLRAALIRHCRNPGELEASIDQLEETCESDFERQVLRQILARGYAKLRSQYRVGGYRIDLVVEGPESRLAVECDGDRWHGPDDWHKDRARQQVLERAGWTFERIRGSAFYRDRSAALEPLWRRLDEFRIPTGVEWLQTVPRSTVRTVFSSTSTDDQKPEGRGGEKSAQPQASPLDPPGPTQPARPRPLQAPLPPPIAGGAVAGPLLGSPALPGPGHAPPAPRLPTHPGPVLTGSTPGHTTAEAPMPPAPMQARTPVPSTLAPYTPWSAKPLAEVASASMESIVNGLVEIVSAEGPMHALRAYRLYVKASGGERVSRELHHKLNRATAYGIRSRRLAQISDSIQGQTEKTLYLPGTPPVVVRELGPRSLVDVPRSEVATLMAELGPHAPRLPLYRAVLDLYGLTRLTGRAERYLDECRVYRWTT